MCGRTTRRAVLLSCFAAAARGAKGRLFPSEVRSYKDALTEFTIERLTSPEYASWLPSAHCRTVSRRAAFVVFGSERNGSPQLYRLDHRTGSSQQLTEAAALDRTVFTLLPGDRTLLYFDGPSLRALTLETLREREIYRVRNGWERAPGLGITRSGDMALLIEVRDRVYEVRAAPVSARAAQTVFTSPEAAAWPLPRPRAAEMLYRRDDGLLWVASFEGKANRRVPTAAGRIGPAYWRPDGETVLYLCTTDEGRSEIREADPDSGADRLVAATSGFVQFSPNTDGSVFAGASGSKAQPHIILLLRKPRRELTLCEHRASRPRDSAPVFSPDSQRLYFQTDAEGQPAVYSAGIERLVEAT